MMTVVAGLRNHTNESTRLDRVVWRHRPLPEQPENQENGCADIRILHPLVLLALYNLSLPLFIATFCISCNFSVYREKEYFSVYTVFAKVFKLTQFAKRLTIILNMYFL